MDTAALIACWRRYVVANRSRANVCQQEGDLFGAQLCQARGEVRQAAADLLTYLATEPEKAAVEMHKRATALWRHSFPMIGFDEAALKYMRSRTWQHCARSIDPSLPIVQPKMK